MICPPPTHLLVVQVLRHCEENWRLIPFASVSFYTLAPHNGRLTSFCGIKHSYNWIALQKLQMLGLTSCQHVHDNVIYVLIFLVKWIWTFEHEYVCTWLKLVWGDRRSWSASDNEISLCFPLQTEGGDSFLFRILPRKVLNDSQWERGKKGAPD